MGVTIKNKLLSMSTENIAILTLILTAISPCVFVTVWPGTPEGPIFEGVCMTILAVGITVVRLLAFSDFWCPRRPG